MSVDRSKPAFRLRPRQWVGAAVDVAGALVIAQQLVGWIAR
jgi:drug/metabolite transporter (DMT)-like permease